MGGPIGTLEDLFIFNSKKSAEKFKHKDPYFLNKLVRYSNFIEHNI